MSPTDPVTVINNKDRQRFETFVDDDYAYIDYRMYEGRMVLMHTFVPEKLRGRAIANQLAKYALTYVDREKIPVKIFCPFVTAYILRHPEYEYLKDRLVKNPED